MLSLLLTWVSAAVAAPPPPALDAAQQRVLEQGDVVLLPVSGGGGAQASALMRVDASPDEIWSIVSDPRHLQASASGVKSLTLTRDDALADGRRQQHLSYVVKVALSEVHYSVVRTYDFSDGRMTWTLDPTVDSDIQATDGAFTLWPQPDGSTLFGYDIRLDSGRKLPRWLLDELTEASLKRFLRYVRDTAEG